MARDSTKDQPKINSIITQIVPLNNISPHPRNYNRHDEAQIDSLRQSLRLFNYVRRIVIQASGNGRFTCIAGHGLMTAAKLEGYTELECTIIPAAWPDAKVLAYLAADNETARAGAPDMVQLQAIIDEIAAWQQTTDESELTTIGLSEQRLAEIKEQAMRQQNILPDVTWPEYDETAADDVQYHQCPACGHRWPQ